MRGDRAPALRAFIELRRLPAVRRLARAQAHLRSFAFGNSHKGKQESRKFSKDKGAGFRFRVSGPGLLGLSLLNTEF